MRPLSVLAVALLVLTLVVTPAISATSDASGTGPVLDRSQSNAEFEPADPHTVIRVNVTESGDARWSVTYRYLLSGENETTAFQQYGEDVAEGSVNVGFSPRTFQQFATQAGEWTDREMQIQDAGWEDVRLYERPSEAPVAAARTTTTAETSTTESTQPTGYVGELTYSFTWTNFAEVRQNTIVVGDAFGTADRTWFNRLYDGQRLILNGPNNYGIRDSPDDKGPNNGTLRWDGPAEFAPGYMQVTYFAPSDPDPTTSPPNQDPEEGISPIFVGAGVGLLVVAVGAGAYLFAKRQTDKGQTDQGHDVPKATPNGGQAATSETTDGGSSGGEPVAAGSAATAGTPDPSPDEPEDATIEQDEEDEDESIDPELLSDEERVLRLLDDNGGRMKQANIVKDTGWSNAKVSQLLSGMDEDDEIQKLRIGRENLITLPDENVGDFDDVR